MSSQTNLLRSHPRNISWLGKKIKGFTFQPKQTDQSKINNASCVHHSLKVALEVGNRVIWLKSDDQDKLNQNIDLAWLIGACPPPTTAEKLIKTLKSSMWKGKLKAENSHETTFKVVDSKTYELGGSNADIGVVRENLRIIFHHLEEHGCVIGSFYPDENYDPTSHEVYVSNGSKHTVMCRECFRGLTYRHDVCVTGLMMAVVDGQEQFTFEYLESEKTEDCKHGKQGLCYMSLESMYSITIPIIKD